MLIISEPRRKFPGIEDLENEEIVISGLVREAIKDDDCPANRPI
jgi:hypothetical protein